MTEEHLCLYVLQSVSVCFSVCCVCVFGWIYIHAWVLVEVIGQYWVSSSNTFHLSFLRQVLSLNLGLADSASLAAGSRDLGFTFLPAPRARVTRVQPSFYHGCWESELRFRYLHGRTFQLLSHIPSPSFAVSMQQFQPLYVIFLFHLYAACPLSPCVW